MSKTSDHEDRLRLTSRSRIRANSSRRLLWLASSIIAVLLGWVTTFSSSPGLGDGPESVAGAQVFGVLHAPGYILYSGLGWLFTRVLWFVSSEAAVSVLSLAASAVSVVFVFLLGKRLGAGSASSALGAVIFGLSSSVWFYSSYAKHTAVTSLAVAALIYTTVLLDEKATTRRAVVAGGLIGASLGFGWPVIATVAPVTVWTVWKRGGWRSLGRLAAAAVPVALLVVGLVFWRASQSLSVNWGAVDSASRLVDLLLMADFGLLSASEAGEVSPQVGGEGDFGLVGAFWDFLRILTRNVGVVSVALAVLAIVTRASRRIWVLVAVAGINLLALSVMLGVEDRGLDSVLIMGGFMAPSVVAVSVLAGVGAHQLIRDSRRWIRLAGVGFALAAVVASIGAHRAGATHPREDLALLYAEDVFAEVPEDGVIVAWLAERAFPFVYAQRVHGLRPDITVVAADGFTADWYIQETARNGLPVADGNDLDAAVSDSVAQWVGDGIPVHIDMAAWLRFRQVIPTQVTGITAEATSASEDATSQAVDRVESLASRPFMDDPLHRRWPNETAMSSYPRAAVILADQALRAGDTDSARRLLEAALRLDPHNDVGRQTLEELPAEDSDR